MNNPEFAHVIWECGSFLGNHALSRVANHPWSTRPASQVAVAMGLMAADESSTRSPSLSRPSPPLPGSQPASTSPGREAPHLQLQQPQVSVRNQDLLSFHAA